MSVSRTITIRLVTNYETFSDLFFDFAINNWFENPKQIFQSLSIDDIDEFDFIPFDSFDKLRPILDFREQNSLTNYISIVVDKYEENILLGCLKKETSYKNFKSHFEWTITLGIGKRIENAERYTDFGFYQNQIIPNLIKLGCYICELNYHDFDS